MRSPPTRRRSPSASLTAFPGSTTISACGISFPAAFQGTDFDNDGEVGFTYKNFLFYNLGAQMQMGAWGVGIAGRLSELRLAARNAAGRSSRSPRRSASCISSSDGASSGVSSAVAGALAAVTLSIDLAPNGTATNELDMSGVGPEVGVLIRPDFEPWRIGATFRAAVEGLRTPAPAVRDREGRPSSRRRACSCHGSSRSEPLFKWARGRSTRVGSIPTSRKPASESRSSDDRSRGARPRKQSCAEIAGSRAHVRTSARAFLPGDVHSSRGGRAPRPESRQLCWTSAARVMTTGRASGSPCCSMS